MGKILELPPGSILTSCNHRKLDRVSHTLNFDHTKYMTVKNQSELVWLDETTKTGHYGTCPTCEARYFSRFDTKYILGRGGKTFFDILERMITNG